MLIIANKKIPEEAKNSLQKYGELDMLETSGITEDSISGHPDLFFCKANNKLILAPNLPESYKDILETKNISFIEGKSNVGIKYPEAACYNAVITEKYLIHKSNITETEIINDCNNLSKIYVNQGFTRCSLLALKENYFITSDEGIYKTLISQELQVLLVSPNDIILPGHSYGFFGGTCGIYEDILFIIGNLNFYKDGESIRKFVQSLNYTIIELYNGPLFDGGSIIFIQQ